MKLLIIILGIILYFFLGHAINRLSLKRNEKEHESNVELFRFIDMFLWFPIFTVITIKDYYLTFIKKQDGI